MTNQEAYNELSSVCYGMDKELEELVLSALKKQIPMEKRGVDFDGDDVVYACGECIMAVSDRETYCHCCGQRIKKKGE